VARSAARNAGWKLCYHVERGSSPPALAIAATIFGKAKRVMSEASDDILYYTESNRRAWNEIAQVRSTTQPPAEFFAEGNSTLNKQELQAAGDVQGRRLLHLQCATVRVLSPGQ
jgi:hypothetical protein